MACTCGCPGGQCCCCYLPCGMTMTLGQANDRGCCCDCRPSTDYRPRPYCPQRCDNPPNCWCHPCTAPPTCCRPGAYNPRRLPPGTCPPLCCCQPKCKIPPKCMPPPCRPCNRPCCQKPPLLPVPAYQPWTIVPSCLETKS